MFELALPSDTDSAPSDSGRPSLIEILTPPPLILRIFNHFLWPRPVTPLGLWNSGKPSPWTGSVFVFLKHFSFSLNFWSFVFPGSVFQIQLFLTTLRHRTDSLEPPPPSHGPSRTAAAITRTLQNRRHQSSVSYCLNVVNSAPRLKETRGTT